MFILGRPRYEGDAGNGGTGSGGSGEGGDGNSSAGGGSQASASGTALTGAPASGSPSGTPPTTPDWAVGLPDDLKSSPSLATYKDLPSFVKSALEAEKLIGKKGIIKPGENATPEELSRYYKELGRPEKPEEYGLKKPEDWPNDVPFSDALVPKVAEMFHKNGIPGDQAQKLWSDYHNMIKEEFTSHVSLSEQQVNEGLSKLKQEWGGEDKYNANLETAKMAVKEFGGDSLINFLNESGLGNHPDLIRAFANAGQGLREDGFVGGGNNSGTMNESRAKAEIEKLNNDKEFTKILYSRAPEDRDAQQAAKIRMEKLHEIAYPTFTS